MWRWPISDRGSLDHPSALDVDRDDPTWRGLVDDVGDAANRVYHDRARILAREGRRGQLQVPQVGELQRSTGWIGNDRFAAHRVGGNESRASRCRLPR